jgi:hypothetical protein
VPEIQKTVDAWAAAGPKPDLIYGGSKTNFKKLPVAAVRLTVGEEVQTLPAAEAAKEVSFDVEMKGNLPQSVRAELLDSSGKVLAGGYYVYCRFEGDAK